MNLFIHEAVSEDGYQLAKDLGALHQKEAINAYLAQRKLRLEEDEDNNLFIFNLDDVNASNVFRFYKLLENRL